MWSRMSLYYYVREMNRTRDCKALYRRLTEAREDLYLIERWWKNTRLYQVRNQLYEPAVRRWCEIHDTILYRTGESCRNLWEYHCKKIYPAWSDFLIVMTSSRIVFFFHPIYSNNHASLSRFQCPLCLLSRSRMEALPRRTHLDFLRRELSWTLRGHRHIRDTWMERWCSLGTTWSEKYKNLFLHTSPNRSRTIVFEPRHSQDSISSHE